MKINKIIAILIVLLVVVAIIYFYQNNKNQTYEKYNGFKVYRTKDAYDIEIFLAKDSNPHYITARYNPKDLEYINVEKNLKEKILRNYIYISLTPELTSTSVVAAAEISKITGNQFLFNIPTKSALTYTKEEIPVRRCIHATNKTAVILLQLSDKTRVYSRNECVIVEGINEEEIIKASTALTLNLLGVMDD